MTAPLAAPSLEKPPLAARVALRLARLPGVNRHHVLWARSHVLEWTLSLRRPFYPRVLGHRMTQREIGHAGEVLATRWLPQQGRKVLYRNYFAPGGGEVDIVARHGKVLTFIEVKTRTSADFGRPADAVNAKKRQLIQRGAHHWLRIMRWPHVRYRFDILEVLLLPGEEPRLNLIENAFGLSDSVMIGR
jgi:putative endonuclease